MARRRGLADSERLALDMAYVTSTGTLVAAPCFLYSAVFSVTNSNSTGSCQLADTSASADAYIETKRIDVTLGAGGVSAANGNLTMVWNPPIYIATTLAAGATGSKVSVTYLAAS